MSFACLRWFLLILCILFCGTAPTHGASSSNVPVENHVYRDIEKLVSAGLIKDAIYAQRPWSRGEIARMIAEARRSLAANPKPDSVRSASMAKEILQRLESEYRDELSGADRTRFHLLRAANLSATLLDSPARLVPEQNGRGIIHAAVNPLVAYREGRPFAHGGTLTLETEHEAQFGKYFSVYARPQLDILANRHGPDNVDVRVQALYGKLSFGNVEIEAGRDSLIWGHGEYGGVLASVNARNLDIAKISNGRPFALPSIFRYLGPSKYTFFVANLRSDYVLKNAYLYGFAASFKPVSLLEIGFKHQTTAGGDGAPDVTLWQKIRELFFVRASGYPQESMDNREGVDLRVQIPKLRNAVLYAEGVFEDFGRESILPQFKEQMGFTSGVYFPLLTPDGADDLRLEYEHSPASYGRHGLYTSGLTVDGRLRGSEIGPDGVGLHVIWRHSFSTGSQLRCEAHYEDRGNDLYTQTLTPYGQGDRVVRVTDNPTERRFRILSSLDWKPMGNWTVRPQLGYEYVRNFSFDPRTNRHNFLGAVSLSWAPGQ
jgi:hypothetical protein